MTDNNIQGKVLFPLLKLHPFFPNLLPAFIFLLRKKINAIQILKNISMLRYICHFLLPTRIGNRASGKDGKASVSKRHLTGAVRL